MNNGFEEFASFVFFSFFLGYLLKRKIEVLNSSSEKEWEGGRERKFNEMVMPVDFCVDGTFKSPSPSVASNIFKLLSFEVFFDIFSTIFSKFNIFQTDVSQKEREKNKKK